MFYPSVEYLMWRPCRLSMFRLVTLSESIPVCHICYAKICNIYSRFDLDFLLWSALFFFSFTFLFSYHLLFLEVAILRKSCEFVHVLLVHRFRVRKAESNPTSIINYTNSQSCVQSEIAKSCFRFLLR